MDGEIVNICGVHFRDGFCGSYLESIGGDMERL